MALDCAQVYGFAPVSSTDRQLASFLRQVLARGPRIQLAGDHARDQAACSVGAPLVGALPCSAPGRQRASRLAPTEQTALRPAPVPPLQEAEPSLLILRGPALLLL